MKTLIITACSTTRSRAAEMVRDLCERSIEERGTASYISGVKNNGSLKKEFIALEWIGDGFVGDDRLRQHRSEFTASVMGENAKAALNTLTRDNQRLRKRLAEALQRVALLELQSVIDDSERKGES